LVASAGVALGSRIICLEDQANAFGIMRDVGFILLLDSLPIGIDRDGCYTRWLQTGRGLGPRFAQPHSRPTGSSGADHVEQHLEPSYLERSGLDRASRYRTLGEWAYRLTCSHEAATSFV